MELTILGSGTAVPSMRRGSPGYLLAVGNDQVVLDTGSGTMRRLLRAGLTHDRVTHLVYSHNHIDHTGELASWLFASRIPASARSAPLALCGSAGFMKMLEGLRGTFGSWLDAGTYRLDSIPLEAGGSTRFEGWSLEASPVNHIDSSLAYRITDTEGRVFVYSGDTDVCDELVALSRDADLLLIESSFPDEEKVEGHLTPSEAGEIARRAGAKKAVLTHFYPPCDEVDMLAQLARTYDGEALLAEDGLRVSV